MTTQERLAEANPSDRAGSRHPRTLVRLIAFALLGVALLAGGIWIPRYWVFLLGAVSAPLGLALVTLHLTGRRRPGRPRLPLVGAVAVVALLVAAAVIAAPRAMVAQMDGPYLWRDDAAPQRPKVYLSAQTLLVVDADLIRGLDPATGRERFSLSRRSQAVSVGADGTFFVVSGERGSYHSADGKLLWEIPTPIRPGGRRSTLATAIGNGTVVLPDCEGQQCVYRAYKGSGAPTWTMTGGRSDVSLRNGPVSGHVDDTSRVRLVPAVVAIAGVPAGGGAGVEGTRVGAMTVGLDGRVLGRHEGSIAAAVGEVVLLSRADCQYEAVRAGQAIWRTSDLPCTKMRGMTLFPDRFYMWTATAQGKINGGFTVDLDDGQWRSTPALHLDSWDDRLPEETTGVAGNDVWVERDGQRLTGVDASTGRVLWRYRSTGVDSAIDVRDGAVTLRSRPDARLKTLADSDARWQVTVLDSRTGRRTAQLVTNGLPLPVGAGPGRAYVQVDTGRSGMLGP
ncbi:PQQ-binding-like beta-propeller repeat protein [Micromonospora sp. DT31]|uniref:outer membrane protein assembly factor BamB family protein n=1 Tax=Micromonospora sp. DT31 TaxID=3393434 RepID=UPI003CF2C264